MLLERSAPLDALDDALEAARAGSGRLVLVGGEAGVGKTTLVRAFCAETGDTRVLHGACDPLSASAQSECAATNGGAAFTFWHPKLVTLHVWLWYPNPDGLYASTNPYVNPLTGM